MKEGTYQPGNPVILDGMAAGEYFIVVSCKDYFSAAIEEIKVSEKGAVQAKSSGSVYIVVVKDKSIEYTVPVVNHDELISYIKANKQSSADFFMKQFKTHEVTLVGEDHMTVVGRKFAAGMVDKLCKDSGSNFGYLALEIDKKKQGDITSFLENGNLDALRDALKGYMYGEHYFKIVDEARKCGFRNSAAKTEVLCMDDHSATDRDQAMFNNLSTHILNKKKKSERILVYIGQGHAQETKKVDWFGTKLAAKIPGEGSYTILTQRGFKSQEDLKRTYELIKANFTDQSLGFDIDKSPIRSAMLRDFQLTTFGQNFDGYIYFKDDSNYQ